MEQDEERALLTAEFNPRVKTYWLLQIVLILLITITGAPLILLTPLLIPLINKRYNAMSCEMTEKFLKVGKGVLVRTEKNVPLEQITDLGIVEGPIMRALGIKQISVETAGQSSQGALVKLVGIVEVEAFRDKVLKQRDELRRSSQTDNVTQEGGDVQVEILATLQRIETLLGENSAARD
jgi:putative membrane protein